MKINERLKAYRLKHGLIQKYVAEQANISAQRLSAIEKGTLKLSVDEFESICIKGLNTNPSYFFADKFLENENLANESIIHLD